MNFKLTANAVFCAVLISGCSSAPTLAVPTGEWESFNQPQQPQGFVPVSSIPPVPYNQGPATTVYKPTEVAAFTPPKPPSSTPVKQAEPTIILPVVEKASVGPAPAHALALPAPSAPTVPNVAGGAIAPPVAAPATTHAPAAVSAPVAAKPTPLPPAGKIKSALGTTVGAGALALAEVKPVAPPPKPLKAWLVSPQDKTIRETLAKWSASEGWTFNPLGRDYWTVPQDFDVVASDTFYGDFKGAVRKLIASTELTKTPLQPCFFSNKAVRVILINEECAAQASQVRNP